MGQARDRPSRPGGPSLALLLPLLPYSPVTYFCTKFEVSRFSCSGDIVGGT